VIASSPAYHDHPPHRLLLNLSDVTRNSKFPSRPLPDAFSASMESSKTSRKPLETIRNARCRDGLECQLTGATTSIASI